MNPDLTYDAYPRCERDCGACHRMVRGADGVHRPDPVEGAYDCRRCQGCGESRRDSIYHQAMENRPVYDDDGDTVREATDHEYHCCEADYNLAHHGTVDPPGLPGGRW